MIRSCDLSNPYDVQLPAHVGVSGGRTSGYLSKMIWDATEHSPDVHYIFTNTGFEHPKTIEFLTRIRDVWGIPIVAIEYTHPCDGSGPDSGAGVKQVELEQCSIDGTPFLTYLEAVHIYRKSLQDQTCPTCGGAGRLIDTQQMFLFEVVCGDCLGDGERNGYSPLPSPGQRLCTGYLKEKTSERWKKQMGFDDDVFVPGLRADEPRRVSKARFRGNICPLAQAGATKPIILDWWKQQPFDLEINDILGNCLGCFLKNQGKLLWIAHYTPAHLEPWAAIERKYCDQFRRSGYSYDEIIEIGQRASDEKADAWIEPSKQESLFGVQGEEMPCKCTD